MGPGAETRNDSNWRATLSAELRHTDSSRSVHLKQLIVRIDSFADRAPRNESYLLYLAPAEGQGSCPRPRDFGGLPRLPQG